MAENKRFNFYDNVFKYMETGIMDNGDKLNGETVCDLLNELAEENQQCKEYNAKLYSNSMKSEKQLLKQIKELKEENKDLELTTGEMEDYLARMEEENKELKKQLTLAKPLYSRRELEKENKELKQQLQQEHTMLDNAIHLERTRMGKNSLIQYKEAIQ